MTGLALLLLSRLRGAKQRRQVAAEKRRALLQRAHHAMRQGAAQ